MRTTTTVFDKNKTAFQSGVRRIVNMGGTSSGKTFSILMVLLWIASNANGTTISVVSETFPHLKLGAIRDFEAILKSLNRYDENNINKTDHIYYFGDSFIEFFAADQGKATGPRRNILFLNECNNIPYSVVSELEQRTSDTIFYDFNPTFDFWISEEVFKLHASEFTLIKSNYLDNELLPESIRKEISLKAARSANYHRIHVEVEFGVYEGLIFPDFTLVDAMPVSHHQRYGMDFGFTNDPSTLIDLRKHNGQLWMDQLMYKTGMINQEIIAELKRLKVSGKIIADSAEPKSIEEIRRAGFNIHPSTKGKDSIRRGIDLLKSYPINVTKSSIDLIRELRNYSWETDRSGKMTGQPIDAYNHLIDPARYAAEDLLTPPVAASVIRPQTIVKMG